MRVEVYESDAEPEKVLRLCVQNITEGVRVFAVSDDGTLQTIADFTRTGIFRRHAIGRESAKKLGIQLDSGDRIAAI